ncbi:uncharacterized protein [Apostichopus japonicus]|uniref:uncharacterized protein n=1 Tax=Stichopus japonicus TaxID=307972 RepID=UPI003AB8ACCE
MASATPLRDMEDNFFQCPICLDHFKEPKLLPCLHRYCRECLQTVVEISQDGAVKCPLCKQDYDIPENGVDDFKTDFHMKSILEFIQLQKCFESQDLKKCISCSKNTIVSAYCFKCCDFLCEECYEIHIINKMFIDHQPHTLKLESIEDNHLTLDKLAALTEDPRCHTHVKESAILCCSSCGNVPVCVICTYSKHKGHDLHDVTELAQSERQLLEKKLAELEIQKPKLYDFSNKISNITRNTKENLAKMTKDFIDQQKPQVDKINKQLAEVADSKGSSLRAIEHRRRQEQGQTRLLFERELAQLKEKYAGQQKATDTKYDNETEDLKERYDEIEDELRRKLRRLEANVENFTSATEQLPRRNEDELKKLSDYCDQIVKRYENFTVTTSSIFASKDKWTYAQCIPDIRAASETLIEEMKKDFPEIELLSDVNLSDLAKSITNDVIIADHPDSVLIVEDFKTKGWKMSGITSTRDGNIVITGESLPEHSHITVMNRRRAILTQKQIKSAKTSTPYRFCCSLSKFKVVTVCYPDEIGIYDVRDKSYRGKKISKFPADRLVWSVTTDPDSKHVFVGTNSRYVYVFDNKLNYIHTIKLPDVISGLQDIILHRGNILVCGDNKCKRAYAINMEGTESKLMYEFTKPDLEGCQFIPISVCTDVNDFIYVLWRASIRGHVNGVIVQYNRDGKQLATTKPINDMVFRLTISRTYDEEKLLVASSTSAKLYTYGL